MSDQKNSAEAWKDFENFVEKNRLQESKNPQVYQILSQIALVTILLAALKATVNKSIQSKGTRDKAAIRGNSNGWAYHIRVLTKREGCPLSCYIELLESEGMLVLHVTTCTSQDRIFHTLIVESDMMRAHDLRGLQKDSAQWLLTLP